MGINGRLVVILVNATGAKGLVTGILLDRRLGPATERTEIREGGIVVVVRIPQRQARERGRATHDWVPLARARVNT